MDTEGKYVIGKFLLEKMEHTLTPEWTEERKEASSKRMKEYWTESNNMKTYSEQ